MAAGCGLDGRLSSSLADCGTGIETARRIAWRQWFWLHAAVYVPTQVILFVIWNAVGAQFPWFACPLLGWGIILAVHGVYAFVMKTPEEIMIEREARAEQPIKPVSF